MERCFSWLFCGKYLNYQLLPTTAKNSMITKGKKQSISNRSKLQNYTNQKYHIYPSSKLTLIKKKIRALQRKSQNLGTPFLENKI